MCSSIIISSKGCTATARISYYIISHHSHSQSTHSTHNIHSVYCTQCCTGDCCIIVLCHCCILCYLTFLTTYTSADIAAPLPPVDTTFKLVSAGPTGLSTLS